MGCRAVPSVEGERSIVEFSKKSLMQDTSSSFFLSVAFVASKMLSTLALRQLDDILMAVHRDCPPWIIFRVEKRKNIATSSGT